MATFIIAEAGVNHNGDINLAKKLVDMTVECGADAIKFQTFKASESTGEFADKAEYQKENHPIEESQLEMIRKLELPFEQFQEIQDYCNEKKIIFISTPDGEESLECLINLNVPLIKIGSTEVTNYKFLKQIGETGKPIILSTGMSNLGEIEKALETIYATGNTNIKLMHCTTDYPTRLEDVNLRAMITMKEAFKIGIGFSDHTLGCEAAIMSVALGAKFIEKHITLDKNMEGPDHKASMDKYEFKKYVQYIRNSEKALGDGIKRATSREEIMKKSVRRSVVAAFDIKVGSVITEDMLTYKRPGYGIEPELSYILIGRKLKRNLKKDEVVLWKDV